MKIELNEITVRELVQDYSDDGEGGVRGYRGKLDIRPPYQREFVYSGKQRDAVIHSVKNNFPLSIMYWSVQKNGKFEIIDGQQRTISIAQYVNHKYSVEFSGKPKNFGGLTSDQREQILNYSLMVYFCEGTDSEKLDWYRTINIAGEKLTNQELNNAVYSGPWVTDAKRYFSRRAAPAQKVAGDYISGSAIRQEHLETAIKWISSDDIEGYMSMHQNDANACPLWEYFNSVIDWVEQIFTEKRPQLMKTVDWGKLYIEFKNKKLNSVKIETELKKLIMDDEVQRKSGIYPYILTRDRKYLNLRSFTNAQKQRAFEKQKGICRKCRKKYEFHDMEGDHITPWSQGGETNDKNCQMLCKRCNRRKSSI